MSAGATRNVIAPGATRDAAAPGATRDAAVPSATRHAPGFDPAAVRRHFPVLAQEVNGHPLCYLDNAATTQKPAVVIDAVASFYRESNANVHRAAHELGERATALYEGARARVARFVGAARPEEIVFTRNATEAVNLVAYAWARRRLGPGDEILLTPMEHHSNLVPWQQVAAEKGARLRYAELTPDGRLDLDSVRAALSERTRLVALTHASNVLGTINPVAEVARLAHAAGALVLVDAAQSVPHLPVAVAELGADWFAFSGHKMLGPTGIGGLWGRYELLDGMEPFLYGGDMIRSVERHRSTWAEVPYRFEAGTPHVAGAVGLAAAVEFLEELGMEAVFAHEQELVRYALERLAELPGVEVYGPPPPRSGLVSFNLRGIHPHDVATFLNEYGVAIRAGHHCAQPLMDWLGVAATNRASFYVYNDRDDVDRLAEALARARAFFGAGGPA